jgi:hypothetical protein
MILFYRKFGLIFLVFILFCQLSEATNYWNGIKTPAIRTLTIGLKGSRSALPVIELNSRDILEVGFDEMSHEYHRYSYRIIHCNADWSTSDLNVAEYLDGFPENDIPDGSASFNSFVPYTHYALEIPNNKTKLKISGNYVVEVFDKYSTNQILLTACFLVAEKKTRITASTTATTDIDYKKDHQQLEFTVQPLGLNIRNLTREIKVQVRQNFRMDTEVRDLKPSGIEGDLLRFEHLSDLIFPGGNEYRRFETTSRKYAGLNVFQISFLSPFYHIELNPFEDRTKEYDFDKDQNGRFLINNVDNDVPDTGSDYFLIHFNIPMEKPILDGTFHLNGDLVYNLTNADSKLEYNFERKAYEKALLLKQGSYNYQYVFRKTGSQTISSAPTEGSFWQTENEYQILVYFRPFGERYDRLIGIKELQTAF